MYIPQRFRMDDDEAIKIMKENPFALLVTANDNRPTATHIPVDIREKDGKVYATGHLAYGNMQKQALANNTDVLLIFQGPNSYISSSWYEAENVPTWNYLAVHAYGTSRIMSDDELEAALVSMLQRYESHRVNGRLWETFTPGFLEKEMKGIVGFEIEITSIEAAGKMSQNRNDTDYKSIVEELEKSRSVGETRVAKTMRNGRPHLF